MRKPFSSLFPSERRIVGEWVSTSSCVVTELSAAAGFDFVIIDNEHAGWGGDRNVDLVRAADSKGVATVVRVAELSEVNVLHALDCGATCVMIPGIKSVADALRAVSYAKYAPVGTRGACPYTRANDYAVNDLLGYYQRANKELTEVILLIEGKQAIEEIDDILQVEGVHSVAVGPVDLSLALGIPGDVTNPLIEDTICDIIAKCKKYGVYYLAQCTSRQEAEKWFGYGADYAMMSDLMLLTEAAKSALDAVRSV